MLSAISYHSPGVSFCLLLLRITLGVMIAAHGMNKIFGGGKIAGTAAWFDSIGMKPGVPNAWAAALTEIGAGLFLIVGFLVPLGCAGVVALMTVAIVTVHRKNGFFLSNPGQGIEYCAMILVTSLALGVLGAGKYSVDYKVIPLHYLNTAGHRFLVVVALGLGGAVLQMAAVYRPGKTQ
jgi:putative oxidoreductase